MAVEASTSIDATRPPNCSHSSDPPTAAVVAHGDSGVGKSALVIRAVTDAASSNPDATQALCINLRHLPTTTLALESYLGAPLATLLAELSAPQRLLVIDGADAISEGMVEPLRYLVDAAVQAGVALIAVAANDAKQLVRDTIAERSGNDVAAFLVPPLTDTEVDTVVSIFGELAALAADVRSRELLRRPRSRGPARSGRPRRHAPQRCRCHAAGVVWAGPPSRAIRPWHAGGP